ncbi:TPA: hypothetical protein DEB29_00920, partial [Candidatus Wolfebacteria bacterium]|nr:hypothetical protein [Candidatus Wolfebacteria bacterium]
MNISRTKITAIVLGDVVLFYTSLFLTLLIRYRGEYISALYSLVYQHLQVFSFILLPWLLVFYLFELYREKNFKPNIATFTLFAQALATNVAVSIALFYFFLPVFGISPKTNLLIFVALFAVLDYVFRLGLGQIFVKRGMRNTILFIGDSPEMATTIEFIRQNPQVGYSVNKWIQKEDDGFDHLKEMIERERINTLVIQSSIIKKSSTVKIVYQL